MNVSIINTLGDGFRIVDGNEEVADFRYLHSSRIYGGTDLNGTKIDTVLQSAPWWDFGLSANKVNILKDEVVAGQIKFFNFRKRANIKLANANGGAKIFKLRTKGWFRPINPKYVLKDEQGNTLFEFIQRLKLLKLRNEYEFNIKNTQVPKELIIELLIYGIYTAEYVLKRNPAVGQ